MSLADSHNESRALPEGYVAIPISEDQKSATLRICVLVKLDPEPVAGHLVVLRETMDARIFLGCLIDGADTVHEWLELWVQSGEGLAEADPASPQLFSNVMLDRRWQQQYQAFAQIDKALLVRTGWESEHPLPTFLDLSERSPVHPTDAGSGARWRLCMDEGLLQQKGLPSYGSSLHRYLHIPEWGDDSPLVPTTPGAPTNDSTRPMSEIGGDFTKMIPLNPHARLMLVKKHVPVSLEAFIDILSGKPWDGLRHGRTALDLDKQVRALDKNQRIPADEGWLFLETQGRSGRLLETFHLKLRLLADVVASVHSMVHHLQRPLFNISPECWQVKLGEPGQGLPFYWTARAVLNELGDAIPLAIEGGDFQYFLPARAGETSVYHPLESSLPPQGRAFIRIRQVSADPHGSATIEGTFSTQERLEMARRDLVWFRLDLACGPVNLYAHLEADSAMATGEWRFRTVAQNIAETTLVPLREAEGVPMADVMFKVIRLLSSPCDLYALAVMALRILLVDETNSLPTVLDETLSLLRQSEAEGDAAADIEQRICAVFASDQRWREILGPHHLTFDDMTPDEAFGFIPPELWWPALAVVLRMFPGPGLYRECKDYGDAPQGGLHRVFERTIGDLHSLIRRTRNLIVTDWNANREITAVLQEFLA